MPASGPNHQGGGRVVQLVWLAFRTGEPDGAVDRVAQVDVTVHIVLPGGRVGVFKIRHEHAGSGVQRVDHHLAVNGTSDLHPAVRQIARNGSDSPLFLANPGGFREKLRKYTGVDLALPRPPALEQLLAVRVEFDAETRHKVES